MALSTYVWLTLFGIIVYAFVVDPYVPIFLALVNKKVGLEFRRMRFYLLHNPEHSWVRWRIEKRYERLAKSMRKELNLPED